MVRRPYPKCPNGMIFDPVRGRCISLVDPPRKKPKSKKVLVQGVTTGRK